MGEVEGSVVAIYAGKVFDAKWRLLADRVEVTSLFGVATARWRGTGDPAEIARAVLLWQADAWTNPQD